MTTNSAAVTVRFYAELNDFLPAARQARPFRHPITPPVSSKHLIESLGIPHTEVEWIRVGETAVSFRYRLQPDDPLHVYPISVLRQQHIAPPLALRPPTPQPIRFLLDNHLGRLARSLRLLGFDARYPRAHYDDSVLAEMAAADGRVMLTRDRGLLMRNRIVHGYCIRTKSPTEQLLAVLDRYQLHEAIAPWTRCLRCNGSLHPVPKAEIAHRLEPKTRQFFHAFHMCAACGQIYWKGSHYAALQQVVAIARNGR